MQTSTEESASPPSIRRLSIIAADLLSVIRRRFLNLPICIKGSHKSMR